MNILPLPTTDEAKLSARADALFDAQHRLSCGRTDRMFIWLLLTEWALGIALALWFTPRTWVGFTSSVHPHVWAAIFFGGAIISLPTFLALRLPGRMETRMAIGIGQMLMAALYIHLLNGRIEAHFQIFGSLAFLAFYRDWRVIAAATATVALDHLWRGAFLPQSVFGIAAVSYWRVVEHVAYVAFEDLFLLLAIRSAIADSRRDALREAALEVVNEHIESQVVARTAELTAEVAERKLVELELASARDVAIAAARSKSQFLANMSHEIRTPMNGVLGMADLLLNTRLDAEQSEFVETIRSSGDMLLTIINDILDFSKIEAGKLEMETLEFDLRQVVETTLAMLAETARARGIELLGHIEPGTCLNFRGDAARLQQVLTNLLNNGIKFTAAGEVVLTVSEELDGTLRFEVRDTGIGISPEIQAKLFRPFQQADETTTRKFGGTGLGLAIAAQLVRLMHGEIGVSSALGLGATFWFTVRLERSTAIVPRQVFGNLAGLRVLIVDDNATNRNILRRQLGFLQMRCAAAQCGRDALDALRRAASLKAPFDCAILDMQMPEMDGLMLAQAIKVDPAISGTRLIMLSSLGNNVDLAEVMDAGVEEYLVKPVKQSRLQDSLARVMGSEPPPPADKPKPTSPTHEIQQASSLRILLAEDNITNQKVALRQLQLLGYTPDIALNGKAVLEMVAKPYDVILMDCQMPELDGYEATAAIRAAEGLDRHTWIIAMTANAMAGDRETCLAAGMDDYLSKPVRMNELSAALKRSTQEKQMVGESAI